MRGPWIASGYFKSEGSDVLDADGWLPTGDVAIIDPNGYVQLVDPAKDVIKSGCEWISAVDLENKATSHPRAMDAAIIRGSHSKWWLLLLILRPGPQVTREELLIFLGERVSRLRVPDDVMFADQLPPTATGKWLKTKLRELYHEYRLPSA